jgi:hypothetical protein
MFWLVSVSGGVASFIAVGGGLVFGAHRDSQAGALPRASATDSKVQHIALPSKATLHISSEKKSTFEPSLALTQRGMLV